MSTALVVSQQTVDVVVRSLMHEAEGRQRNTPHSFVNCPSCSRENSVSVRWIPGMLVLGKPPLRATPGQRCYRCHASLDACVARDVVRD